MANINVPDNPSFSEELRLLETTDQAHPSTWNPIHERLFHNTLFLKLQQTLANTEIARAISIALGRNQALVFNTFAEMQAYFSSPANADAIATITNGTNLYIIDKNVPDYWWSTKDQKYYELETQKADLTKYDNIIGGTDIAGVADGTLTGAVTQLNSDLTQGLCGVVIIPEGSGASVKYYAQLGADAASKKPLGKTPPDMYFWTTSPVDIKSRMPDIYSQLTSVDFMVGTTAASGSYSCKDVGSSGCGARGTGTCSKAYNAAKGILTFGGFSTGYQSASNETGRVWSEGTVFAVWRGTVAGVVQ